MNKKRGLTIYFNDGSKLLLDYPVQSENEYDIITKMKEVLENKFFLMEADGSMLYIPVDNIKYMQVYPAPEKLPAFTIRGASIIDT
ncbi:hypothetical protein MNBD_GAMMA09-1434 [hydrothermal vent metagenome]|uniref:Uncharacterized protein n=1 Tax=hydrothermal vent metagenome TaxID=652676 RepID=A0A3B0YDX4_9ZZZZ